MSKWNWQESEENIDLLLDSSVGDVITLDGKQYTVEKKTRSACSIRRYYWWNKLVDKLLTGKDNNETS
jgi:hypothetical protein